MQSNLCLFAALCVTCPRSSLIQRWRTMLTNWCCCRSPPMRCFNVEKASSRPRMPSTPSGQSLLEWTTQPQQALCPPPSRLLSPLSPWGQYASRSAGRPPLSRPAPQVCTAFHLVIDLSNGNRVWAACATDSGWPRCAMVCGAVHAQQ